MQSSILVLLALPVPLLKRQKLNFAGLNYVFRIPVAGSIVSSSRLYSCGSCAAEERVSVDMGKYKEGFARRMAMAGLQPYHSIAVGVSGGPDSMALCFLTAAWKTDAAGKSDGYVDGLLAIIVDHGLRAESKEEAHIREHLLGIRCEIAECNWSNGRPKQGHLQEAARDMRYQNFQKVCIQHQIGVLLIAHHADDQAELLILRLSRGSGVLGLAGMAFTSQLFSTCTVLHNEGSNNKGLLLVRPLLHFSKEDMYKTCQASNQDWVEDPTNRSAAYARNRIRMSLGKFSSYVFQTEAVNIMDQGYAVIDLMILNPSKVPDMCLSKFVALVLQFVSQRYRTVRGATIKVLLDYVCTFPCKTSFTVAGCYLCPSPGSRGTKLLVCCSVDCPPHSKIEMQVV
ncbi:unnamed protein product [Linum trigynum]|uniref:tRNA(Ile)-lysidine synthetase n=1 Tax=Linum trigynum TaxID=586398 RepID=A0AAV2CSK0_9ROSI